MSDESAPVRPRSGPLAFITFLFSPIAGYLYVGRPGRALAAFVLAIGLVLLFRDGLGGRLAEPGPWLTLLGAAAAVYLVMLIDTLRLAAGGRGYRLRGWNRAWVYILVGLGADFAAQAVVNPALGGFLAVRPFSTPSASMAPTLRPGDDFVANMRAYERGAPQPGDVVVFDRNGDGKETWVKRIVAGPGDRVAMVDGGLVVNGTAVKREPAGELARETLANGRAYEIAPADKAPAALTQMETRTVPADAYFVLGDNRGNSADSRDPALGFVPRARILGRASFLYWSPDRARIGARVE